MIHDYGRQVGLAQLAAVRADKLYNMWHVPDNLPARTIQFGTLTTREMLPKRFWRDNLESLFDTFAQSNLGASGMYAMEFHKDEKLHAHFVIVLEVQFLETLWGALELWKTNLGFVLMQEARDVTKVASYVSKTEVDGNVIDRMLVDEMTLFGRGWEDAVNELEMPLFTGETPHGQA